MLDTVLQIGRAFRESPTRLKHHRYVKSCPQDTEKESVLRLSIPVKEDDDSNLKFDFDKIEIIKDENIIREKLYYLKFKTSDSDGLVKYLFGDIFYEQKSGKEGGYYRLGDTKNRQKAYQVSSFLRGENDYKSIKDLYDNEEESKKSIIKIYGHLLPKQRKKLFKSYFLKKNFDIHRFRSDIAFYHQITSSFITHKELRKDNFFKVVISAFPNEFFTSMKKVCMVMRKRKLWKDMVTEMRPYLRKEVILTSGWILEKKNPKPNEIENLIKLFYTRSMSEEEKKKIMKMNVKKFEIQMKSVYK